jgi:hypothetical protein
MSPALMALLLAAALSRPVRPCLKVGDGPACGCLVTFGGAYIAGPSGPAPSGKKYVRPCDAGQLAYLTKHLPRMLGGEPKP